MIWLGAGAAGCQLINTQSSSKKSSAAAKGGADNIYIEKGKYRTHRNDARDMCQTIAVQKKKADVSLGTYIKCFGGAGHLFCGERRAPQNKENGKKRSSPSVCTQFNTLDQKKK
jgi:hypothetical protein